MEWWVDFWDGVAKSFGYDVWIWGSAGEWIGGLAAAGAIFWAVHVFGRERKAEVRAVADSLMFWHNVVLSPVGDNTAAASGRVTFVNAGTRPVSRIGVIIPHDVEGSAYTLRYISEYILHPGKEHTFHEVDRFLYLVRGYVTYTDGSGREWYRDMQSAYLTPKRIKALKAKVELDLSSLFPNKTPETVELLTALKSGGGAKIRIPGNTPLDIPLTGGTDEK